LAIGHRIALRNQQFFQASLDFGTGDHLIGGHNTCQNHFTPAPREGKVHNGSHHNNDDNNKRKLSLHIYPDRVAAPRLRGKFFRSFLDAAD
jgi:hypothetical protein